MSSTSIEDLLEHYIGLMLTRFEEREDGKLNHDDAFLFAQLVAAQALDNLSGRMNSLYFMLKEELEHDDDQ